MERKLCTCGTKLATGRTKSSSSTKNGKTRFRRKRNNSVQRIFFHSKIKKKNAKQWQPHIRHFVIDVPAICTFITNRRQAAIVTFLISSFIHLKSIRVLSNRKRTVDSEKNGTNQRKWNTHHISQRQSESHVYIQIEFSAWLRKKCVRANERWQNEFKRL